MLHFTGCTRFTHAARNPVQRQCQSINQCPSTKITPPLWKAWWLSRKSSTKASCHSDASAHVYIRDLTVCIMDGRMHEWQNVTEGRIKKEPRSSVVSLCPLLARPEALMAPDLLVMLICHRDNSCECFRRWHLMWTSGPMYFSSLNDSFSNYWTTLLWILFGLFSLHRETASLINLQSQSLM